MKHELRIIFRSGEGTNPYANGHNLYAKAKHYQQSFGAVILQKGSSVHSRFESSKTCPIVLNAFAVLLAHSQPCNFKTVSQYVHMEAGDACMQVNKSNT